MLLKKETAAILTMFPMAEARVRIVVGLTRESKRILYLATSIVSLLFMLLSLHGH